MTLRNLTKTSFIIKVYQYIQALPCTFNTRGKKGLHKNDKSYFRLNNKSKEMLLGNTCLVAYHYTITGEKNTYTQLLENLFLLHTYTPYLPGFKGM